MVNTLPTTRPLPVSRGGPKPNAATRGSMRGSRRVRSLFFSDLHLGIHYSRVEELLWLLDQHQPEFLFLVGDFIDARALHLIPHWPESYDALFNRLAELAANRTLIAYTPGNHDAYLRDVEVPPGDVIVHDEFMHQTADGRRVVVMHGDQFDQVERRARWLSHMGSFAYTCLLASDRSMNRMLKRIRMRPRRMSRFLKQTTKRLVQRVSGFDDRILEHVLSREGDVIVCGHIHIPTVRRLPGRLYFNLGDWVENATALVEYEDGEMELLDCEPMLENLPASEVARLCANSRLTDRAGRIKAALLSGIGVAV